jgi:transcription regulator MmyB-like protein
MPCGRGRYTPGSGAGSLSSRSSPKQVVRWNDRQSSPRSTRRRRHILSLRHPRDLAPSLLQSPVNVSRLSLHPRGVAPRIVNLAEWRAHLFARLRRQIEVTADLALSELMRELSAYPNASADGTNVAHRDYAGVVVPLRFVSLASILSFISTTTVFGTPVDITLYVRFPRSLHPLERTTPAGLPMSASEPKARSKPSEPREGIPRIGLAAVRLRCSAQSNHPVTLRVPLLLREERVLQKRATAFAQTLALAFTLKLPPRQIQQRECSTRLVRSSTGGNCGKALQFSYKCSDVRQLPYQNNWRKA